MGKYSLGSEDDVDARVGVDTGAHATDLKTEGCLFKSSLHLSRSEVSKVTPVSSGAALAELSSNPLGVLGVLDLGHEILDVLYGLLLRASDWLVAVGIVRVARPNMLLQNVAAADGRHLFFT